MFFYPTSLERPGPIEGFDVIIEYLKKEYEALGEYAEEDLQKTREVDHTRKEHFPLCLPSQAEVNCMNAESQGNAVLATEVELLKKKARRSKNFFSASRRELYFVYFRDFCRGSDDSQNIRRYYTGR